MIVQLPSHPLASRVHSPEHLETDLSQEYLQRALIGPCAEFFDRPGKRIRVEVIHLAFEAAGGTGEAPPALIDFVEMLHAGSLAIDDIQDNSCCRRGVETLHLRYGVPLAINIGNWMYFAALESLGEIDLPPDHGLFLLQRALAVIKQCHEGQGLDLSVRIDELPQSNVREIVEKISQWKTGALTGLAAWSGAFAANQNLIDCQQVSQFGQELGVGLQMQNDFVELQKNAVGSKQSDDLNNRRATWPWAWLASSVSGDEYRDLIGVLHVANDPSRFTWIAQQMLQRIEPLAIAQINEKLQGSANLINALLKQSDSQKRLHQLIANLELRYA